MAKEKPTSQYDRTLEDAGNVQLLEHVNLTVADQGIAALFYVTGLGFTRDPYMDFGTSNMWVNAGDTQFHLPTREAQVLRGHIGVVVPDLDDLKTRLRSVAGSLDGTRFAWQEENDCIALSCPFGNRIRAYGPGKFPGINLGIAFVSLQVPSGTAPAIARFYRQMLGSPVTEESGIARVRMGPFQSLVFAETSDPISDYDGHHIAIYIANFSEPHAKLNERGLISEESNQHQYRFQEIVDLDTGECLTEIEHEVRSVSHPLYRRLLVNRNPATNVQNFRRGNEVFVPPDQ